MMQKQHNNSNNTFRELGSGPPSSTAQDGTGSQGENIASGSGDEYFNATFNAMGMQDFPPFQLTRPRASVTGTPSKSFGPTMSATEQMPDDFAALNLASGPMANKSKASEFGPKSPALPHSSSTSSFASYASMFGQNQPATSQNAAAHSGVYSQNSVPAIVPNSLPPATIYSVTAPIPPVSSQNNGITAPPLYGPSTPNNPSTTVNHVNHIAASTNGLIYTSSISPAHSPRISPAGSPLVNRRIHSPTSQSLRQSSLSQKPSSTNLVQESVGGTTYFYTPDEFKPQSEGPRITLPSFCAYSGMPAHIVHLRMKTPVPQYFSPDELKMDILNRHVLSMVQLDPSSTQAAELPEEVDNYHNLCPLERSGSPKPSLGNLPSTTYKAVSTKDGLRYCLRRIHGFRLANTKVNSIIESWKKLYHPNVVQLKEVFTTKAFNDNSIVFVYDYIAGAETLMMQHFTSQNHINGFNNPHHHFSRDHGKGGNSNNRSLNSSNLLAENVIWNYVVQLSSALRTIHSAGLAARSLDPNKILLTGKARLRINCVGIMDIITPENNGPPNLSAFKQEDLTSMGRIILALACNNLMCFQRDNMQSAIDLVQRSYSPDLKNLICYLLHVSNRTRSINDVMPMIGARFFTHLDIAQLRGDVVEHELSKEIENGRLFRVLVKLGSINERPEYNAEPSWAETGDRYMLKLFRDFLFHQVDERGLPWIDMAHVIQCLNKFDAGVSEKVCLVSRDENSMLVVSYSELKRCFQSCFQELVSQPNQTASFS